MIEINKIQTYKKIDINDSLDLIRNIKQLESYCNKCKNSSTFKIDKNMELSKIRNDIESQEKAPRFTEDESYKYQWFKTNNNKIIQFKFDCARHESHNIIYAFLVTLEGLIKIGQYPSDRDLIDNNISKNIKKLISNKEDFNLCNDYLNKSIILNSEGFGIASVLYLRRVFEYVVNSTLDCDTTQYIPMENKIKSSEYLPKEFKENKKIYNILSDGVHNLSDEECNVIFSVMYDGMLILLEEYFYHMERQERLNKFSKDIQKL
jgi:hypothetical protein